MAAREQESFVADASHELKTPITAIEGHARVVVRAIDRSDLPQARESAEIVHREARRLAVMLRELLALAEAGSGAPEPAAVRLDLAVVEACSEIVALEPGRVVEPDLAPARSCRGARPPARAGADPDRQRDQVQPGGTRR